MEIRKGKKEDILPVLGLIKELAIYEKAEDEVEVTMESMLEDGFSGNPVYGFYVAENEDGVVVGVALYYYRYSTWKGKKLYLEDFVVSDGYRGNGIGKLLFDRVLQHSLDENCNGISWQVLDWNKPALNFYDKYSASYDGGWLNGSLSKKEIEGLI